MKKVTTTRDMIIRDILLSKQLQSNKKLRAVTTRSTAYTSERKVFVDRQTFDFVYSLFDYTVICDCDKCYSCYCFVDAYFTVELCCYYDVDDSKQFEITILSR